MCVIVYNRPKKHKNQAETDALAIDIYPLRIGFSRFDKICARSAQFAKRPGLIMAVSSTSGLLVVPITNTISMRRELTPSISINSWVNTRSEALLTLSPDCTERDFAIASISSKQIRHGAASRAFWKMPRTFSSDSPNHLLSSCGPFIEMKLAFDWLAAAFASMVLPQPGGPYSRIPRATGLPYASKTSECSIGS